MSILSFYQRGLQKLADAEKSVASRLSGGLKGLGSAQNQIAQQAAQSIQQTARPTTNTTNVLTNAVKQVNSGIQSLPSIFTTFKQRVQSGNIPEQYKPTQFDLFKSKANSAIRPINQILKPYTKPINNILHPSTFVTSDPQKTPTQKAILSFFNNHPTLKKQTLSFAKGMTEDVPGSLDIADLHSGLKSAYKTLSIETPTEQDFILSNQYAINKAKGLPTTPEMEQASKKVSSSTFNAVAGSVEMPRATQNLSKKLVSNIRTDKLGITSESAQKELKRILDDADNFTAQRRGVRTHEMTSEAADNILPKIKLKPGTILNAEEKHALGNLVKGYSYEIDNLVKVIKEGANHDENLLQLAKLRTDYQTALASLSGSSTEAARSLEANKMINKLLSDPRIRQDEQMMKQALKFSGGREGVQKIAQRLAEFGDDTVGKYKFIQQLSNPHWTEKFFNLIDWYYYNSLLSGPKTQIRNIIGNAFHVGFNVASKPFAGAADLTKTGLYKLAGKQRTREVYAGELPSEVKGLITGIPEAFSKAQFMFKNGFSLNDVVESEFAKPEVFSKILGGRLAKPLNAVSRTMQATDQFFRTVVANSELHALAYKNAKNKGLKGESYKQAVAEFLDNPPLEAVDAMRKAAQEATFQNPNKFAGAIDKITKNWKLDNGAEIWNPLKLIVPFVKTPVNIIARSAEATPIGFVSALLKNSGRQSSKVMGRAFLGSLGLATLWTQAQQGNITGSGPKDKAMRDALYATGWRPNSIKIGDKYYGYQLFAPLSQALSIIGNANDKNIYDGEEPSVENILWGVGMSLSQNSFLAGINQLNEAIQYQDASYITKNVAGAAVPFSALLRSIAVGQDNKIRDTSTALDTMKANIPAGIPFLQNFNRQTVPIKRDIFGRQLEYEGGVLRRVFDPFNTSSQKTDNESNLAQEAIRLGVKIAEPDRKQQLNNLKTNEKVRLDTQQKEQYSIGLGQIMRDTINAAMSSPEYQLLSDDEKRIYLEERIANAKKFIDGSFFINSLSPEQKKELSTKVIDYSIALPTETKDLEVFDPQTGAKLDVSQEDKADYYERMWQGIYDTVTGNEKRDEFQYLDGEQKKDFMNSQVSDLKSFMKDGFTMFKNDKDGFFDDTLRLKLKTDADVKLKNMLIDNAAILIYTTFKAEGNIDSIRGTDKIKILLSQVKSKDDSNRFLSKVTDLFLSQDRSEFNKFLSGQDSETRALYVYNEYKSAKGKDEKSAFGKRLGGYIKDGIFDDAAKKKFAELIMADAEYQSSQQKISNEIKEKNQYFIKKYDNNNVEFDGFYGPQCMDLMAKYVNEVLGIPGNPLGADTAYNSFKKGSPLFDRFFYSSDGSKPQPGDIIYWGPSVGAAGHVAIVNDVNQESFTSFDQNWPKGSPSHKQSHDYNGVIGWLRPKKQ